MAETVAAICSMLWPGHSKEHVPGLIESFFALSYVERVFQSGFLEGLSEKLVQEAFYLLLA